MAAKMLKEMTPTFVLRQIVSLLLLGQTTASMFENVLQRSAAGS